MVSDILSYKDLLLNIGPSNVNIDQVISMIVDDYTKKITSIFIDLEKWRDTLWQAILENIALHLTNPKKNKNQDYNDNGLIKNQDLWTEYEKTVKLLKRILPYVDSELLPYSMVIIEEEYDDNGKKYIKYNDSSIDDFNDITSDTTISNNNDNYCNPEYVSLRYNSVIPMSQKLIYNRRSRLEAIGREYFRSNDKENIQLLCEEDRNPIDVSKFIHCVDKHFNVHNCLFGQMSSTSYDKYSATYSIKSYMRVDSKKNILWLENVRILMNGKIPKYVSKDWKPNQIYSNLEIKIPILTNILTMRKKVSECSFVRRIQFIDNKSIGYTKYIPKYISKFVRKKLNIQEILNLYDININISNYKLNRKEFCEFININRFIQNSYIQDYMPIGFIKKEIKVQEGGGLPFIGSWQLAPEENMEYSRIHDKMGKYIQYCIYGENAKFIRNAFIKAAYDGNVKICRFVQKNANGTFTKKLQAWKLYKFKNDKYMVVFGDLR